ncbi:MAG: preprotein translocase subunit SecE [bacterium]|nr:preprotein translocase subunit SecE [bacterium]
MKSRKIVTICLIFVAVFLYWVASQFLDNLFDWLNIAITRDLYLTIPEIVAVVVAVGGFFVLIKYKKAMDFFTEAVSELSKVTFPTKKESGQSAVVVVVLVAIATLLLAFYDLIWSTLTRWILN